MSKTFTCKNCEDREPGCHDKCKKYQKEKAAWERAKAEHKKGREADYYTIDNIHKMKKRRNK